MGEVKPLDRKQVVDQLTKKGVKMDLACMYADAFMEYRTASENIREHGAMVLHPRTGSPIENPYLAIRDRARTALQRMRVPKADFLWKE